MRLRRTKTGVVGAAFFYKKTFSLLNTYLSALEVGKLPDALIVRFYRAD